jgi:hypothetical protein
LQIVSLLDVVELAFPDLVRTLRELGEVDCRLRQNPGQRLSVKDQARLLTYLETIKGFADCLDLDATFEAARSFLERLNVAWKKFPSQEEAAGLIEGVRNSLQAQLASRKFGFIPRDKLKYWMAERLFGDQVYCKFERARTDLQESGNCFAMGQYTASVFHLMRVMEVGLLRLAKRFKVKDTARKTWGEIIGEIQNEINQRKRIPRSKATAVKYDPIIAYFRSAKDGWRNRVCHSTVSYTEPQAASIFSATEGFMRALAEMF